MSLCYPEKIIAVAFPAYMKAELIGKNGYNHQLLETNSGAVVVFRDDNVAEIRGNPVSVVTAQSIIEGQIEQHARRRAESGSPTDRHDATSNQLGLYRMGEATSQEIIDRRDGRKQPYGGSVEVDELWVQKPDAIEASLNRKSATPTLTTASAAVAADQSIIVFSKKLGYSEQDVCRVIERLGPEADRNAVLDTLLKFARKSQPENGSLLAPQRPTSSRPTLRAIVIDGSNVAMRLVFVVVCFVACVAALCGRAGKWVIGRGVDGVG